MKTIIIIAVLAMATVAFGADTYEAVTKDGTAESVEAVQVKKTVQSDEIVTLQYLYARRAQLNAELAEIQAQIDAVKPVAEKVMLYVPKVSE